MFRVKSALAVLAFAATVSSRSIGTKPSSDCRCFPGDDCWPTAEEWTQFNSTIDGKLIRTVPLATPCHGDNYDNATCTEQQNSWTDPELHYPDSASIMAPFFANRSCDPFTDPGYGCVLGTYVQYSINVSSPADVAAGIRFSNDRNIRLVIRNTGHDYNGKSTGAGALGLWMQNLKSTEIKDWSDEHYTGKAIKMAAGVLGGEAYAAADAAGLQVVGGECPTVGLAGGYTQGGGHSALSSRHGMAADQALEWEVVTGTGEHLIANREKNTDLYWALSGGGGGTYGVVLSLTSKAHPDVPTSGATLSFTSANVSKDAYYEAISTFHSSLSKSADAGIMSVWYFTNETFAINPLTGPELTPDELKGFVAPLMAKLDELNIAYTSHFEQFPSYLTFFKAMFESSPIPVGIAQYGGRLIPRSVVENNNAALTDAYRFITERGAQFIGVAANTSLARAGFPDNAVNPGWRTNLIDTVITTPWDFTAPWEEMLANQDLMTDVLLPPLAELTPNGSVYLNEADFQDPLWKEHYYGVNYDALEAIKDKYDPHHLFYALTAVGSDYWEPQEDGRLCKA